MHRLIPCLLLIALLWSSGLQAQIPRSPIFHKLEFLKNGHTSSQVGFKFQDSRGFLWGIDKSFIPARFDGNHLDLFQHDPSDTTSISDGAIWGFNRGYLEDSRGWIWISYSTNSNLDCYDPKTEKFRRFRSRLREVAAKINADPGFIRYVFEDSRKDIWIGCDYGAFKYDPVRDSILFLTKVGIVPLIFEDDDRNIWLSAYRNYQKHALGRINPETGKMEEWVEYPPFIQGYPDQPPHYHSFHWKRDSSIYLVVQYRLLQFHPKERKVTWRHENVFGKDELIYDCLAGDETVLMTTSAPRFLQYFPSNDSLQTLYDWPGKEGIEIYAYNLFQSSDGITWIFFAEYIHDDPELTTFQIIPEKIPFQTVPRPLSIPPLHHYSNFLLKMNGKVYFFTPPRLKAVRQGQLPPLQLDLPGPGSGIVSYRYASDREGNLWWVALVGEYGEVRKFDPSGKLVFLHRSKTNWNAEGAYPGGRPTGLAVDQNEKLWIATGGGLVFFDPDTRTFHHYGKEISNHSGCNTVLVNRKNNIWCGTFLRLSHLDQQTGQWTHYDPETSRLSGIIHHIYQDVRGTVWVATLGGLFQFQEENKDFRYYGPDQGLENTPVYMLFEDPHQQLWAMSDQLYWYDAARDLFLPFGKKEGVAAIGLQYTESAIDEDGFVYLLSGPGEGDVCYFKPQKMDLLPSAPDIHFTNLFLFNKKVKPLGEDGILPLGLDFVEKIRFRYDQNDFAVHFTAPEYIHPEELRFFIKLDGFHKEWQDLGNSREARFTNLSPGKYTFQVKVRDRNFFESETPRTLIITILPPWYRTTLAYLLWLTLTLGAIYSFYRFQLRRRLAIAEAERLKALDQAKTQLYTNITHEFRTPLTVILGMAEQVKGDPKNWFNEGLGLIRRNGKQLLNLVNQMLDLSKLESGHMRLNLVQGDIIGYLRYLCESFHSYADSKDIRLHFASDFKELSMDFDPEKMQHIFSNLLSNAIKFTQAGGDVYIECSVLNVQVSVKGEETVQIKVRDNGRGIAPEHLPHIFDRFYQVDPSATRRGEGTGIGLALTKELVKLMGGRIEVESELDKGAQFSIRLPVTRMAEPATTTPEEAAIGDVIQLERPFTPGEPEVPSGDQPLVLLIEDNADVITYLRSFLGGEYQIITATNGQEGIDKALDHIPDLVVSDVMMPEKDGFEVCATLKTDERTSHIPVILLTAKSDDASRLEGLTHGADAYLAKPFNKEELLVRIEKLIELRRRLQAHYQRAGELVQLKEKTDPTPEDRFLQKLVAIVEENLADENFGLPDLCRKAGLSRSQLFRKVKALTGKPTTHFIRSIRLARAKELLETTGMSVSEVAFAVGFSWLNYFSRVFREEFGVMPSEVRGK